MPGGQQAASTQTLARTLLNAEALKKWISENPGSNRIRTFLLHRSQLKEDLNCDSCENSIAEEDHIVKINDRELLDGTDNFIWCTTCDQIEHLSCLKLEKLSDDQAPWICPDCKEDPDNPSAQELVKERRTTHSLDRRLKVISAPPADPNTYEEIMSFFVKSLQVDIVHGAPDLLQVKARIEEQKKQAESLGQKLNEAAVKITDLKSTIDTQAEEIVQLKIDLSRNTSTRKPSSENQSEEKQARIPFMTYAEDYGTSFNAFQDTAVNRGRKNRIYTTEESPLDRTMEVCKTIQLQTLRNVLPIVREFNGDSSKWLTFERQVNLVKSEGEYNSQFMKYLIRDKLSGIAAALVENLYETHEWDEIMNVLKDAFGNPNLVVDARRKQVQKIKLPIKLTHAAVIEAKTIVNGYTQACRQANVQAHDRSLALLIYNQLDQRYCEGYYAFFKQQHPYETREERLDVIMEYLDSIKDTLPPGTYTFSELKDSPKTPKPCTNVIATITSDPPKPGTSSQSNPRSTNTKPRSEVYEIRNINEAKHQGYDLEKLKTYPARCLSCGRDGHYTVECTGYKRKSIEERQRFVDSKHLCRACIISADHQANQCPLKRYCGAFVQNNRCTAKHHLSLHTQSNSKAKRFKGTYNRNRNEISSAKPDKPSFQPAQTDAYSGLPVPSTQGNNSAVFTNLPSDGFLMLTASSTSTTNVESSPRTIKLFRTLIQHNNKVAAAFTVGDSAAEISLIKRSLIDALGITGPPAVVGIQWTDKSSKNITGIKVDILIKGILPDSEEILVKDCYAVDDFNLPPRSLNVEQLKENYPYLSSIPFESYQNAVPAVLLGSRHAALIEAVKPVWEDGEGKPIGVLTKLGYSIYGPSNEDQQLSALNAIASEVENDIEFITNEQLSEQLEVSVSLENMHLKPINTQLTEDEKSALAQAENSLTHLPSGHIQMPLIWKLVNGKRPTLPDNFPMVLRRQLAQERKLQKHPELLEAFNNNFKTEIDAGYIRGATLNDMHTEHNVNYVPMSLVVNANKRPIKTRNVYDASAKYKGTSLNANLLAGPNLLIDLLKPLMSMQECAIAITGDVQSMFNRIRIDPIDQNCQRILWRSDVKQPMQIFIKESMLFGPTSSPFTSQFAKNWIAEQFHSRYPETSKSIKTEVYMDDWFTSAPSVEAAIKRVKEGITIFAAAQMNLVGIQSNSPEVLSALPPAHIKRELIPLTTDLQTHYISKVLGVNWNTTIDCIVFELNEDLLKDKFILTGIKPTKREQCSLIARIFDVLGLLAHCIIRARILLQHSWKQHVDWDDEITDKDSILWSEWLVDLKKAASVQIPRQRSSLKSLKEADNIELHIFSDAGQEAIAAVAYMVVIHSGRRESSFVLAKAKVAPLKLKSKKEITEMPRLELLAALIGARLAAHICSLHAHLKMKQIFWCDSEVVLRWIWNTNLKLPRFAISPISEILETSEIKQWKYVDTKQNVADLATKFQPFDFSDSQSVWFTGPDFLKLEPVHWPSQTFTDPQKENAVLCAAQLAELDRTSHDTIKEDPMKLLPRRLPPYDCALLSLKDKVTGEIRNSAIMNQLIERKPVMYYTWSKLVRATARMLLVRNKVIIPLLQSKKWRHRLTRKSILATAQPKAPISSELIESAELFLIRFMQRQHWPTEIEALLKGKRINNKKLLTLSVFVDNDGILRVSSRVSLSYNEYPQKYAPLIPESCDPNSLTETMLFFYHNMYRHVCLEAQIAEFRSKYWMIALRERLKTISFRCNCCKLARSKQRPPYMADLPQFRVDRRLQPFEVTGLDCCGPFLVEADGEKRKVWILLFTCTVTRFIHVELLFSLDTKSTLSAILSTYAAHGPLIQLISDHGTNFVGASNLLNREHAKNTEQLKKCQDDVNHHFISQLKQFRWTFLPVKAAWFGGFYERLIAEIKRGLREEIQAKGTDLPIFKIAMYETVHRLNNRPLTHIPVSNEDEEVLTPHMLAKNRPGWPLLPSAHALTSTNKEIEDRSYYVEGQKLADRITRRFYNNYLTELTQRTKWNRKVPPLIVGDLVLVIDPNETRHKWKRGEIISFRPSGDSTPRVAEVRTTKGVKPIAIQYLAKIGIQRA